MVILTTGYKTFLKTNSRYIIGRDSDADFIVNSTHVSRQQLEINVGPPGKTSLQIVVLSRARTMINEKVYKLSKTNVSPIKLDYSVENVVEIKFRSGGGTDDLYTTIQWVDFNVYTEESLTSLKSYNLDFNLTGISKATHYHGPEKGDAFKKSLIAGLTILEDTWVEGIKSGKTDVDWLHNTRGYLSPNAKRKSFLSGYTFVCFGEFPWVEMLGTLLRGELEDGVIDLSMLDSVGSVFVAVVTDGYSDKSIPVTTESTLFECVKSISTEKLSSFSSEQLKRLTAKRKRVEKPIEPEVAPMKSRKRAKYERVNTMHFFDIKDEPMLQEYQVEQPKLPQHEQSEDPKQSEQLRTPADTAERSNLKRRSSLESDQPTKLQKLDKGLTPPPAAESQKGNKTSSSTSATESPIADETTPIAPIKAKVSLVDAIIRTKENATKTSNEELGLNITQEAPRDISENLKDLAIIEEVEITLRIPKRELNSVANSKYSTRRNFKNFRKNAVNEKTKYLELATVLDQEPSYAAEIDRSLGIEQRLEKDFQGLMNSVGVEKLFVEEDSEPELSARVSYEVHDDDDDEDDDQPRFGFSTRR